MAQQQFKAATDMKQLFEKLKAEQKKTAVEQK
jgi:hypothetical protein